MNLWSWILLVLVNVAWGASYVAAKIALVEFPPLTLAVIRFAVAGLMMLPFLFFAGPDARISRRDWPMVAAVGLLAFTLAYLVQYTGVSLTTATNAALLMVSLPVFVALLAHFVLKERLTRRSAAGILVALAGVALVTGIGRESLSGLIRSENFLGNLLVVSGEVSGAVYTIIGRRVMERYKPLVITTYAVWIGLLGLLPFAALEWGTHAIHMPSLRAWGAIAFLAAVCTVFGYTVWYAVLAKVEANKVAVFVNLQPIVGVLLGVFYLKEPLTLTVAIGGALTLIGVYVTSTPGRSAGVTSTSSLSQVDTQVDA